MEANPNNEDTAINDLLSLADGIKDDDEFCNIVNGDYVGIINLLGKEAALKLYIHYRGCHISFPKHFYKPEHIVSVASTYKEKREREKLAIMCGYTAQWLERRVKEFLNCDDSNIGEDDFIQPDK